MAVPSNLGKQRGKPTHGAAKDEGLVREIVAAVSTDEVAARVLVTGCATLAVGWLGLKEAVGAVVASQIFSEAVKRAVERARLSARKTWAAVLLLLLFNLGQRAFAAVRRGLVGGGAGTPLRHGLRASAVATATVTVLAVGTITAFEIALGHSLVSDRRTTLFSAGVPVDQEVTPTPKPPPDPQPGPTRQHVPRLHPAAYEPARGSQRGRWGAASRST